MSRELRRNRELKVKRTHEPGRLWQDCLTIAYERLVSKRVYVIHVAPDQVDCRCETQEQRVEEKSA